MWERFEAVKDDQEGRPKKNQEFNDLFKKSDMVQFKFDRLRRAWCVVHMAKNELQKK